MLEYISLSVDFRMMFLLIRRLGLIAWFITIFFVVIVLWNFRA